MKAKKILPIFLLIFVLSGCGNRWKYDDIESELSELKTQASELQWVKESLETKKTQLEENVQSLKEQNALLREQLNYSRDIMRIPVTEEFGLKSIKHPLFSFTYDDHKLGDDLHAFIRPYGIELWYLTENTWGTLITLYLIPESSMSLYELEEGTIIMRLPNDNVIAKKIPISLEFTDDELGTKLSNVIRSIVVRP